MRRRFSLAVVCAVLLSVGVVSAQVMQRGSTPVDQMTQRLARCLDLQNALLDGQLVGTASAKQQFLAAFEAANVGKTLDDKFFVVDKAKK